MSEQEMWQFIDSQKSVQVCSLNSDGSPHLTTMWFHVSDWKIVLVSYTKSQKIVNLKRNPTIAVLIEDGLDYHELRGVSINSVAELVDDDEKVRSFEKDLILRNQTSLTPDQAEDIAAKMSAKKTAILVKPDKVMSWDHGKLGKEY